MTPLLVSGIASVANHLIDTWSGVSQRKLAVEQAQFEGAMKKAMAAGAAANTPAGRAAQLQARVLEAPEVQSAVSAQDPAQPASLQISQDGKLWLQPADGRAAREVFVAPETRELVTELVALRSGA